jgi:hypothetical protein
MSTEVTVPTDHVLFVVKSYEVPLIVNVLEVGTPPKPLIVYVGMFSVLLIKVDDPLDPVVVRVIVFCLLLNVVQSADERYPLDDAPDCEIEIVLLVIYNGLVALVIL